MKIEVWMEGYIVTGMEGTPSPAHKIIEGDFETFDEAVETWVEKHVVQADKYLSKSEKTGRWSYWGCGLYDNEIEARKTFG